MTDAQARPQPSPTPRAVPPVLPPLSKFYCGPAQGWNSAEASPSQNASTWSLVSPGQDIASARQTPPAATPPPSTHWQSHVVEEQVSSFGNQGWDSRPQSSSIDTTTWGPSYRHNAFNGADSSLPPLLPPQPSLSADQAQTPRDQSSKRISPRSVPKLIESACQVSLVLGIQQAFKISLKRSLLTFSYLLKC